MEFLLYIKLLRPKNWLKNIFVFIPLVFSLALNDVSKLANTVIAFVVFCIVSSSVYIFNDIRDIEIDRAHPIKCNRPLASGEARVSTAAFISVALAVAALALAFYINMALVLVSALYMAENIVYTVFLKHKPIYDSYCIAAGFVLRIYAGSFASAEPVSDWLFLTIISMSLFMAFGKRRGEMLRVESSGQRAVLESYSLAFLNGMVFVCAGLSVAFYALWAMSREMNIIYTTPIIIFIVCRYLLIICSEDSHGDPASVIISDKTLICACAFYAAFVVYLLYAGSSL
jgi:4-hydroxybenzoate polyprenyltransferase